MAQRLEKDDYFIQVADLVKRRGTCVRRQVGCVIVNQYHHIIATGYNGMARNLPHCIDTPCPGANFSTGEGLDLCEAIHAEQNALLQCPDVMAIHAVYCTDSPCIHCMKLLTNTSVKTIFYLKPYTKYLAQAEMLAERSGIKMVQLNLESAAV